MDLKSLAVSKTYTDISVEGAGAIKGKNCVISSEVIEGGHRVTAGWYRDSDDAYQELHFDVMNGVDGADGADGKDGKDGVDGVQPVLSIGTVTKGTTASATITGTAADPKLNLVLPQGDTGVGIVSIAKTATSGITDTYTVTYSNSNTDTFTVTNGDSVVSASVDDFNNLSFTMASGADINAGQIQLKGQQGYFPCGAELIWNGTTAPQGFLMCDGSEYLKTAYPQLAAFLAATDTAQGTTYFAGSDSAHFKVPDAKGEYYRGAGTNSHTGQGNGGLVGEHQDASEILKTYGEDSAFDYPSISATDFENTFDSVKNYPNKTYRKTSGTSTGWDVNAKTYTARPTSTSKNYIIAYQDIYLAPRHQYSTEEQVVGVDVDGRPIYERKFTNVNVSSSTVINTGIKNIQDIIDFNCVFHYTSTVNEFLPNVPGDPGALNTNWSIGVSRFVENSAGEMQFNLNQHSSWSQRTNRYINYTIQYTKTTDIVS